MLYHKSQDRIKSDLKCFNTLANNILKIKMLHKMFTFARPHDDFCFCLFFMLFMPSAFVLPSMSYYLHYRDCHI